LTGVGGSANLLNVEGKICSNSRESLADGF